MLRRLAVPFLLALSILVATLGLTRLRFDTDVLSMLPGHLPEVQGLKTFHDAFLRSDELILLLEGSDGDEGSLDEAASSLGEHLRARGVVGQIRWQPRWADEPEGLAEMIAYLWLNGDPAMATEFAGRLSIENSIGTLSEARHRVGTTLGGLDMVMLAHDPFGFLEHPSLVELIESSDQNAGAFESEDGLAHLLIAEAPGEVNGYRAADEWMGKIRAAVEEWLQEEGKGLTVRYTGEPVFSSEIGRSMEADLSGSIGITLGLIGILFWWMQRRLSLLLGLVGVLTLVFAIALGVAGWMYGELSIMALSSIEILIGLSVDYGLVICQEAKVAGHDRMKLRLAAARPVMCGALTTTVVFLALNFGGLPGMAQLGTIVAIGLSAAAVLMMVLYLPFVSKYGVNRTVEGTGKCLPRRRISWWITGGACLAAIAVLSIHGLPHAEFDSKILRPRNSQAFESFERLQEKFPSWNDGTIGVVVEAATDQEMLGRIGEAKRRFGKAGDEGLLAAAVLPTGWWPDEGHQRANRQVLANLAAARGRLMDEADTAGFTAAGGALGQAVLEKLAEQTREDGLVYPRTEAAQEVMRLFMTRRDDGGGYLLGSLHPGEEIQPEARDYPRFRQLMGEGILLSGWSLFKPAIALLVKEDIAKMMLPMLALLLGMMALIFRRVSDVCLAMMAMAVSTLLLLAIMSLTGLKWNFVNLMATPLMLGTGIDYAIHVTLSLRRTGGDFQDLWNGTGKALLFCAAANAIGFGSLCLSSSEALVSLGIVAVIGITLSMVVSVFLLPGWRTSRVLEGES